MVAQISRTDFDVREVGENITRKSIKHILLDFLRFGLDALHESNIVTPFIKIISCFKCLVFKLIDNIFVIYCVIELNPILPIIKSFLRQIFRGVRAL